jgi:hypothetical protein
MTPSLEERVSRLEAEVQALLANATGVAARHPLADIAGIGANDPLFDDWKKAVEDYRH